MGVSVLIPFFYRDHTDNLRNCLQSLQEQTRRPEQIIICDDSMEERRPEVKKLCTELGAHLFIEFPFTAGKPQWSKKFNDAYPHVTEDMILILCSNWILEPRWLEEMVKDLEGLGKGNMVAGDSARQGMGDGQGNTYDWFAGFPDFFLVPNLLCGIFSDFKRVEEVEGAKDFVYQMNKYWDYMDEGFLNLMWKEDWLVWDEDFDQIGAWHAVCEWGFRLFYEGLKLWIRRDLKATHQERHPLPEWLDQTSESHKLYLKKLTEQGCIFST